MKKISIRLIISSILLLMISSLIPNIIFHIFGQEYSHTTDINPLWIFLTATLTISVAMILYRLLINQIIIKRIKILNQATKKVIQGHYDIQITDQKKDEISDLTHHFNKMVHALKQNEYVSKNFIRNFSHEYKTPLATIKGYAEIIQEDTSLTKEAKEYLDIIIDESNRLSTLSHHMLLISQIDHQIIIPKDETINITEELRKVIQTKQLSFEEKDLQFDLDIFDIRVQTNQSFIYQAFSNIIDNAIKYTFPKQTIHIQFIQHQDTIDMIFSNPTLIKNIDETQIFNMFYTTSSQSTKSNGIGLALVKKIVEKLGGTIQAHLTHSIFTLIISFPKTTNIVHS